ncbi:hypothetical protein SDC9_164542 [bioreactor metagenome]|uniref:Uncharacterized protein n=1 Tax=bioreactor metagenome TaxID=1076179 RepID=A0A645FU71_9ZZZZ
MGEICIHLDNSISAKFKGFFETSYISGSQTQFSAAVQGVNFAGLLNGIIIRHLAGAIGAVVVNDQ